MVVLGVLCTAVAFVVYSTLIAEAGTSRATVITYVNPVVAVALGVALLSERPGAGAVAGLPPILAGGWLSTDGRAAPCSVRPLFASAGNPSEQKRTQASPAGEVG